MFDRLQYTVTYLYARRVNGEWLEILTFYFVALKKTRREQ